MATPGSVVEHIVLFRARDGADHAALRNWTQGLRSLADLEGILHLYVGAVVSFKPDDAVWSFALYARFCDQASLQAYALHPRHLDVVALGGTLFIETMALDWKASVSQPSAPTSFPAAPSGFRVAFLRWKEPGVFDDDVISWLHQKPYSTSGSNFSPARARGFVWGCVSMLQDEHEQPSEDTGLQVLTNSSGLEKYLLLDIDIRRGI